jgi:hypothetical protein
MDINLYTGKLIDKLINEELKTNLLIKVYID